MRRLARLAERRPEENRPLVVVVVVVVVVVGVDEPSKGSRPVREFFRFNVEAPET